MTNSTDPDQIMASSDLIWIYTVFKGNAYPVSAGQGLNDRTIFSIKLRQNRELGELKFVICCLYDLIRDMEMVFLCPFSACKIPLSFYMSYLKQCK